MRKPVKILLAASIIQKLIRMLIVDIKGGRLTGQRRLIRCTCNQEEALLVVLLSEDEDPKDG